MSLEVIEPGLLTTVQDAGRTGWTPLGVPIGGACDGWSLAVANLLVSNDAGAAALEMTLIGPTLAVREPTTIGLAGADLGGIVRETGRRLAPGGSHRLEAGQTIAFPGADQGLRSYLALPGGIDVPEVLGSRSTVLAAGFGGLDGRAIRASDHIAGRRRDGAPLGRRWPALPDDPFSGPWSSEPIRVVAGPSGAATADLVAAEWRVGTASDRTGIRLEGPAVEALQARAAGELLSHGVVHGAIQVPPGGAPIVLLADHQTTGGYPIAAVVISADHPRLGQLRPGTMIRFREVSVAEARAALAAQRKALARGASVLRDDAAADDLWQSAGG